MAIKQCLVYVIDDDESVRRSFGRLLRSAGLKGETFASAEEFFAQPKQAEDSCILVDIRMPGTTGFDFQQRLNERCMTIPTIVVSASDDELIREHAKQLGAVAFFRKPVDDQALIDAIWWAINGK